MYTLITGASSGIGKMCAESFAAKWHNLILMARSIDKLKVIQSELESAHDTSILVYQLDVSNSQRVEEIFQSLSEKNIEIDFCLNNAGLALWESEFTQVSWDDLNTMIQVNITGFTQVAHRVLPFLKKTDGMIVNISSVAGIESYEWGHVYCASKAYVKMLSKSLRIDLMGTNVRVTDIAPWAVETDGFAMTRFKWDSNKAANVYAGYQPLLTQDIVDTIEFCRERPKHVNIEYISIMPTAQASARRISKK